jgi:hypothetical protein
MANPAIPKYYSGYWEVFFNGNIGFKRVRFFFEFREPGFLWGRARFGAEVPPSDF